MKLMRALIDRYQKWLMIGLVVFLMLIFTVADDFQGILGTDDDTSRPPGADEVAGSFFVVPGVKVDVTNARFTRGRRALRALAFVIGGRSTEPTVLQVWSHVIRAEAAGHSGIHVSDRQLVDTMRTWNGGLSRLMDDKEQYEQFCQNNFRTSRNGFEQSFREALEAYRVRQLYSDTFVISPPATRTKLVEQFAPSSFEYVEVSWAAQDSAQYLADAAKELDAAEDKNKLLKTYFDADPAVKADTEAFRHSRRFDFELLYAMHDRLTDENLKQAELMFNKLWPKYSPEKNDGEDALAWAEGENKRYWGQYQERLLEAEKKTLDGVRKEAEASIEEKDKLAKEKEDEQSGDDEKQPDEEENADDEKNLDEANPDQDDVGKQAALMLLKQRRIEEALKEMGLKICAERINRELRLRRMMRLMHNDAYAAPEKSLSVLFEKLQSADDKQNPLCSTEPGKGLFVFLAPETALSSKDISELMDGDVTFGPNVAFRVSAVARKKLPAVRESADVLGDRGQGRMSVRVKGIERERRKTFDELRGDDLDQLREEFYLPHQARERARKSLEDLKQQCDSGEVKPGGFGDAARKLGARFYANEKITASSRNMPPEPSDRMFYENELRRMTDRHFLRRRLAGILAADRIKPKEEDRIQPGSWLPVEVQSDTDDPAEDPGTVYLVQLLGRTKPTAATMPEESMKSARLTAAQQGAGRSRTRWDINYQALFRDFELTLAAHMKERVQAAFDRIAEREADRISSR